MKRPHKYHARRTEYAGELYDSKAEAAHAERLDWLKRAGKIHDWRRGRRFTLIDGPKPSERVTYRPDFEVLGPVGVEYVVDVKGVRTQVFRLKALLWRRTFPTIPLVVVDRRGRETARYLGAAVDEFTGGLTP